MFLNGELLNYDIMYYLRFLESIPFFNKSDDIVDILYINSTVVGHLPTKIITKIVGQEDKVHTFEFYHE